jgi:hypothetical protein
VTPFLPSLVQEKKLGFDVGFELPGVMLLIQFKLGVALQRFRRIDKTYPPPSLEKPFWRFNVDTAETSGQYDLLLKAESAGAFALYAAPRLTNWDGYALAYCDQRVLTSSVLIRPLAIAQALSAKGEPDGLHRIVYDKSRVYVLSEPLQVEETSANDLPARILQHINESGLSTHSSLSRLYESLGTRREVRQPQQTAPTRDALPHVTDTIDVPETSPEQRAARRARRLTELATRLETDDRARFAVAGEEAWAIGSQLFAVTR